MIQELAGGEIHSGMIDVYPGQVGRGPSHTASRSN